MANRSILVPLLLGLLAAGPAMASRTLQQEFPGTGHGKGKGSIVTQQLPVVAQAEYVMPSNGIVFEQQYVAPVHAQSEPFMNKFMDKFKKQQPSMLAAQPVLVSPTGAAAPPIYSSGLALPTPQPYVKPKAELAKNLFKFFTLGAEIVKLPDLEYIPPTRIPMGKGSLQGGSYGGATQFQTTQQLTPGYQPQPTGMTVLGGSAGLQQLNGVYGQGQFVTQGGQQLQPYGGQVGTSGGAVIPQPSPGDSGQAAQGGAQQQAGGQMVQQQYVNGQPVQQQNGQPQQYLNPGSSTPLYNYQIVPSGMPGAAAAGAAQAQVPQAAVGSGAQPASTQISGATSIAPVAPRGL